jgi:CheY-like chemotaxis protein
MYQNPPPMAWSPGARPQPQPAEPAQVLLAAVTEPDFHRVPLQGFTRTVAARTTAEILTLLAREQPAVLIVDLDLPDVDGAAVCKAAASGTTNVLVVMSAPGQAPHVLRAGCHAILLKPFAPNLLSARLGRLVRERQQQLRLRGIGSSALSGQWGTNRAWPGVACPRCHVANATGFEFESHRRMWFACLACDHVWVGPRQE